MTSGEIVFIEKPEEIISLLKDTCKNADFEFVKNTIGVIRRYSYFGTKFRCVIKKETDKIAGFVLYWFNKKYAYVHTLYVEKEFRKMGIGSELMENVYRDSERNGFLKLQLKCEASDDVAISFYKKEGFFEIKADNKYPTKVILEKVFGNGSYF